MYHGVRWPSEWGQVTLHHLTSSCLCTSVTWTAERFIHTLDWPFYAWARRTDGLWVTRLGFLRLCMQSGWSVHAVQHSVPASHRFASSLGFVRRFMLTAAGVSSLCGDCGGLFGLENDESA